LNKKGFAPNPSTWILGILKNTRNSPKLQENGPGRAIAHESSTCLSPWLISAAFFLGNQLLNNLLIYAFGTGDQQMCKLDCAWYQGIAQTGYTAINPIHISYEKMENWAFFPLFPAAAKLLLESFRLRPETATVLTAKLLFFLSIYFFIKFGRLYLGKASSLTLGFVAAFNPYSIYANAGYSEPLFLMLTCLFFIQLKRGNYWLSGVFGFLLPLTRLVGIASFASMGLEIWLHKKEMPRKKMVAGLIALVVIPFGLIMFMAHLHQQTGDALAFIHIQKAWRGSDNPLSPVSWILSLIRGFSNDTLWLYPYWALTGTIALIACTLFLLRGHDSIKPLALFSLICTLLPISSDTWGMSRYVWWQAPILLAICALIRMFSRQKLALMAWATIAFAVNIYCYRQWFTPLKWHVS
jgi:hypothetical protein